MGSVVTREVGELNGHMEKAVESIRERKKGNAGSEMQLSMTSINNLALMLNDHFDMMMQMMANAMPGAGKKSKQKGKSSMNLGQMQQQLNQLGYHGADGRPLETTSGKFGPQTEHALRAFQADRGLKVDGEYGDRSRAALAASTREAARDPAAASALPLTRGETAAGGREPRETPISPADPRRAQSPVAAPRRASPGRRRKTARCVRSRSLPARNKS